MIGTSNTLRACYRLGLFEIVMQNLLKLHLKQLLFNIVNKDKLINYLICQAMKQINRSTRKVHDTHSTEMSEHFGENRVKFKLQNALTACIEDSFPMYMYIGPFPGRHFH